MTTRNKATTPAAAIAAAVVAWGACGGGSGEAADADADAQPETETGADADADADADAQPETETGADADADGGDEGDAPAENYSLTFGPIAVDAGQSGTQCVVVRLGNPAVLHVGRIQATFDGVARQLVVYRTNATTEQPTPSDCEPFAGTLDPAAASPLAVTAPSADTWALPAGVAYLLQPGQLIRLELRYVNGSAAAATAQATATFEGLAAASFHDEADLLFIGDVDVDIPPASMATLGPVYFPLPAGLGDAHFFAVTGHEHRLGTNVQVSTAASASGPFTSVYGVPAFDWSEPATAFADPPFAVPTGGGFRFQCDWDNTSASTVTFGAGADNELCFFWAYYYPSHGAKVCVHTQASGSPVHVCCPGDSSCPVLGL